MHELSLAQSIFNVCLAEMKIHHYSRVSKVTLNIGEMMTIEPGTLQSFFSDLVDESPLQDVCLEIHEIPVECECENCGEVFRVKNHLFRCPRCRHREYKMKHGGEFEITDIEGEEPAKKNYPTG